MNRLQRRTVHFLVLTMLISGAFSLVMTTGAKRVRAASTWFVTNKNSSGDGSLFWATSNARSGDTIKFASSVRGEMVIFGLTVSAGVTIIGPGRDQLTLLGAQQSTAFVEIIRVFSGNGEVTTISGLKLSRGAGRFGGAIRNSGNLVVKDCDLIANNSFHNDAIFGSGAGGAIYNSGQLTIKNCLIRQGAGHGPGGAIYSRGQLTISDSTLENSTSSGTVDGESGGGAIFINSECTAVITNTTIRNNQCFSTGGGGITNEGFVTMENCTIANNGSVESGGGIENLHSITLTQCTIANNTAVRAGGGVASLAGPGEDRTAVLRACTVTNNSTSGTDGGSGAGGLAGLKEWSIQLLNTIVAGNKENSDFSDAPDVGGPFTSFGHNLIGHTVSTGWLGTDKTNVDPLFVLDANGNPLLADNGGPTHTVALKPASPALDAGDDSIIPSLIPDTDQRGAGFHRVVDGNDDHTPKVDIGAYELQANAYPTLTVTNAFFIEVNSTLIKTIGTALDEETIPRRLTLLINGGETARVNGVFLAVSIADNGTMNAEVRAACESSDATFALLLIDENNQSVGASLTIRPVRQPPVITANNITTNAPAGQCSVTIPVSATVVDSCGDPVTYTLGIGQSPITSPHTFPVGVTTVTVWAVEPVTQVPVSGSFLVTIKDVMAPEITPPADITKNIDPQQCSAVVSFAPAVTDTCDQNPSVVCSPASGSTFQKGTSTVNCAATDDFGNSAACSFTVTVRDNQAPVFDSCSNIATSAASGQCSAVVSYTRAATDTCDGGRTVTCNPASGSTFQKGVTTVNCAASDTSGNTGQCSFTVTVNDTQVPSITCPANITTGTDPNRCSANVSFNVTAGDNCGAVAPVCAPPSGSSFPKGSTTVTCSASDAAGNSSSCSFTVTIRDTQPPVIACPAAVTAVFSSAGGLSGTVDYPTPVSSDNCAILSVACTPPSGSAFPLGTTTVTCTGTDTSANSATCSFVVNTFDACLQDDSVGGTVLLWNSATGDYRFCCGGTSYGGKGTVARKGNIFTLTDNSGGRRLMATVDTSQNKGIASLQTPPGVNKCSITDRDTRNNTCSCM
jgi:hypothetical protein